MIKENFTNQIFPNKINIFDVYTNVSRRRDDPPFLYNLFYPFCLLNINYGERFSLFARRML